MEVGQPLHLEVEVGGIPQPEVSLLSNSYFPLIKGYHKHFDIFTLYTIDCFLFLSFDFHFNLS